MGVINAVVETTDINEAEKLVQSLYPVARMRDVQGVFRFRQAVRGDERFTLARFGIGPGLDVGVEMPRVVGIGQLLSGEYEVASNGDSVDTAAPFVLRPGEARSHSEGLDLLMVNFDEGALATFAGAASGVDAAGLRFLDTGPLDAKASRFWSRTVAYASTVLAQEELYTNEIIRGALCNTLFAAALTTFPITIVGTADAVDGTAPAPRTIRRAIAFMEDNAHRHISVGDVAVASRMSVRGLQDAFRRYLDVTPTEYIRSVRLERARADLLASNPFDTTVTVVAQRWGFAHEGRFATAYRHAMGELPSDTLRR